MYDQFLLMVNGLDQWLSQWKFYFKKIFHDGLNILGTLSRMVTTTEIGISDSNLNPGRDCFQFIHCKILRKDTDISFIGQIEFSSHGKEKSFGGWKL